MWLQIWPLKEPQRWTKLDLGNSTAASEENLHIFLGCLVLKTCQNPNFNEIQDGRQNGAPMNVGQKQCKTLKESPFKSFLFVSGYDGIRKSYCADGAYLHHENIVSKKMS